MKTNKIATAKIVRNSRPLKNTNFYRPALQIIYNKFPKKYIIKINEYNKKFKLSNNLLEEFLNKEDFKELEKRTVKKKLKEYQFLFEAIENEARRVINSIDNFSFEKFENLMFGEQKEIKDDIFFDLQHKENSLKEKGRIGTAETYTRVLNALHKFYKRKKLPYSSITPSFLEQFEKWLLSENTKVKSINSVGVYMRNIRALCNNAKNNGIINESEYPFGKSKYQISLLKKETIKALTIDEVKKIKNYKTHIENRMKAKDYWMFSYLCNGMNIIDIANLRYRNIKKGKLVFIREKTKETTKTRQISIELSLHNEAKEIIKRRGNSKKDDFIFPIINKDMNAISRKKEIAKLNQFITKNIKKIAKELEINPDITAVYARHSFATILMNQEVPIEYISKALGHSDISTTSNYLGKFDMKIMKEHSAKLL